MLPRDLRQYSNRKVYLVLGAIIAISVIAAGATLLALSALTAVRATAQINTSARAQLQTLLLNLRTAESCNRGYIITSESDYLSRYEKAVVDARQSLSSLDSQTQNVSYRGSVESLLPKVAEALIALDDTVKLKQSGNSDTAHMTADLAGNTSLMDDIESKANALEVIQTSQLDEDRTSVQALSDIARDISVVTVVLTLIFAITVYYLYLKAIQSERRLDRAKDEFVSLASHQLRTPATGIKSILSTLVAGDFGPLNERQTHFLGRAIESNERELGIIEELLNVAKADAGRLILRSTQFELSDLIESVVSEQSGVIGQKNQSLKIKHPSHPLKIFADEEKLFMAVGNLLDNARKYTPDLGKISISTSKRHGDIFIEVTDNGIGIEPDELDHIFDRFQRAGDSMLGNVDGAGLGLYLARRIAELHGGTIEAKSRLGKGTKFVMILPQGDHDAAESAVS